MLRTTWRCNLVFLIRFVFLSSKVMLLPVTAAQAELHTHSDFMSYTNYKGGTLIWSVVYTVSTPCHYFFFYYAIFLPVFRSQKPRACSWPLPPPQDSGGGHITSQPCPHGPLVRGQREASQQTVAEGGLSWKILIIRTKNYTIKDSSRNRTRSKGQTWNVSGKMEERWCGQSINKQRRNE